MSFVPNFEIELPLLPILLQRSKEEYCFVETHTNKIIPVKDCFIEEKETELYVKGVDYINNITIELAASDIKIITTTDKDNTFVKKQKENFTAIAEMCIAENITINVEFLYDNVPIHEKLISMTLGKKFPNISLQELKDFWKNNITKYCLKFEDYIEKELNESPINDVFKRELLLIKNEILDIKQFKVLNKISSKEWLVAYWPALLAPAPIFVNVST